MIEENKTLTEAQYFEFNRMRRESKAIQGQARIYFLKARELNSKIDELNRRISSPWAVAFLTLSLLLAVVLTPGHWYSFDIFETNYGHIFVLITFLWYGALQLDLHFLKRERENNRSRLEELEVRWCNVTSLFMPRFQEINSCIDEWGNWTEAARELQNDCDKYIWEEVTNNPWTTQSDNKPA